MRRPGLPVPTPRVRRRPADLDQMLMLYEDKRSPYNEVIVDARAWLRALPHSLEAIYYHMEHASRAKQLAQKLRSTFARAFGVREASVPLLVLDRRDWSRPFRPV